jgi:hypothetical protein
MTGLCTIPGCRIRNRHLPGCEDEKCGGCLPRVAEDGYCCPACASLAAQNLGLVAEVALAVSDAANRLSAGSDGGGSGKPGSRLPLDLGARAKLDGVEGSLYGWARHVAEERGVQVPGLPVAPKPQVGPVCRTRYECVHDSCKTIRDPAGMPVLLAVVAGWLVGHLDWLAHRPEVDEAFGDFAACARIVRGIVRGPADQRYLGPCGAVRSCEGLVVGDWPEADCGNHVVHELHELPPCDGDVYVRGDARTGRCKTCGAEVDRSDREAWLSGEVRGWAFRASEIAEAYRVNVDTIRSWAFRGHLKSYYRTETGIVAPWNDVAAGAKAERLHYVGDVLDLAAADAARREENRAKRARRMEQRSGEEAA